MQFNRLTFLVVLFFLGCNSSENANTGELHPNSPIVDAVVLQDSLLLNTSTGLFYYHGYPFTGKAFSKYNNGITALKIDYLKGKKDGLYQKFFPDGRISFEAEYSNGRINGKNRTWWLNGNLRTESNFVAGVPHGIQVQYYKSGSLFKKLNLAEGKEEGLQQSWRENGKIYNNYEAKNGRIFGLKRSKLCFQLDDEEVQY